MWDLVWQSPEAGLILTGTLVGMALAGTALTVLGRGRELRDAAPALVTARVARQARRSRRSRRRAA